MKILHAVILSLIFVEVEIPALAGFAPGTGVVGSPHDMNIYRNGGDPLVRVCVYCHTPHHAVTSLDLGVTTYLPLWNRNVPEVTSFVPYQWAVPSGMKVDEIADPLIGPTRLCLSCHDGVTAIDAYGGLMASSGTMHLGSGAVDLSRSHPVGFDYLHVAAAINSRLSPGNKVALGGIADPYQGFAVSIDSTTSVSGQYNTVTRSASGGVIADHLYQGRYMTCITCHDVHNEFNVGQEIFIYGDAAEVPPNFFLRAKLRDSLICLSCHIK